MSNIKSALKLEAKMSIEEVEQMLPVSQEILVDNTKEILVDNTPSDQLMVDSSPSHLILKPGVYCSTTEGLVDISQVRVVEVDHNVGYVYQELPAHPGHELPAHPGHELGGHPAAHFSYQPPPLWVNKLPQPQNSQDSQQDQLIEEATPSKSLRFTCSQCDYKTDRKSNFDSHVKLVHLKDKPKCPECGKEVANLNQHLRVVHKNPKSGILTKTQCSKCNKQFYDLTKHMLRTHDEIKEDIICKLCNKTFKKTEHLTRHERSVHLGIKYSCNECGKNVSNINKHLRTVHRVSIVYSCQQCGKVSSNKQHHNKECHPDNLIPMTTPILPSINHEESENCLISSSISNHINTHLEFQNKNVNGQSAPSILVKSKTYPCKKCDKTFSSSQMLVKHEKCEHTITQCNICKKNFSHLAQHIKIVHNQVKNHGCENCGKGFYDKRELRRHHLRFLEAGECKAGNNWTHHQFKHYRYACQDCPYKTDKKGNMDMHKTSVHMGLKQECPECGKQLSSKVNLNSHMKNVHKKKNGLSTKLTKNEPFRLRFSCKLCSYKTNRATHLDRHILSVHPAAAVDTVTSVYNASTQTNKQTKQNNSNYNSLVFPGRSSIRFPQFSSLVTLEQLPAGEDTKSQQELLPQEEILYHKPKETQYFSNNQNQLYQNVMTDEPVWRHPDNADEQLLQLNGDVYYVESWKQTIKPSPAPTQLSSSQ